MAQSFVQVLFFVKMCKNVANENIGIKLQKKKLKEMVGNQWLNFTRKFYQIYANKQPKEKYTFIIQLAWKDLRVETKTGKQIKSKKKINQQHHLMLCVRKANV